MAESYDAHQIARAHILVAEDDQIARLVLEKMLEQAGYKAHFVADGREAVNALMLMDYDLVLMDCLMPRLDGFAATRLVRNAKPSVINPKIPIIAMTGLSGEDSRRRCLDAGMDDHIAKPLEAGELISAIERCLGRKEEKNCVAHHDPGAGVTAWDDVFLDTLITRFLDEIPDVVEDLQRAHEGGDLPALEHVGHRLCGASDILAISALSSRLKALEEAGKTGDLFNARRLAAEVIIELNRMSEALKNEVR